MNIVRSLEGSVALTKLPCMLMTTKKGTEGIFIPTDAANLIKGKEGALYLPIKVALYDEENEFGQHGFVSLNVNPKAKYNKKWKQLSKDEQEKLKEINVILGNVKDWQFEGNSDAPADETVHTEDSDDMPF